MNITFLVSEQQSSHGVPRQEREEAGILLRIVLPTLASIHITLINEEENNLFLCGIVQGKITENGFMVFFYTSKRFNVHWPVLIFPYFNTFFCNCIFIRDINGLV